MSKEKVDIESIVALASKEAAAEASKVIEQRLVNTFIEQVRVVLQPLNISEIDHLKAEVGYLNAIIQKVSGNYIGLLLIQRAVNRLHKEKLDEGKTKDEQAKRGKFSGGRKVEESGSVIR